MRYRKVGIVAAAICGLVLSVSNGNAQRPVKTVKSAKQAAPTKSTAQQDTSVKIGKLANGLTYYIRANAKPDRMAKLLLVVRAGSNQEDDDQLGLAHFVEHMAFNGTTRFKEHELVNYLESIGLRFGADLNAATSFDQTTYELQVPTDKPQPLSTAFDILEDWAGGILFDSAEVIAERGVVLEEWRRGLGAGAKIRDQQLPVLYKGSRYATRMPIGTPEIIQSANPKALKRFYRDWYRPNLMAVVTVGDFDPAIIEAMITKRFAGLKNPKSERPRETYTVPGNVEPLFSVVSDSQVTATNISVNYKMPQTMGDEATQMRIGLAQSFFIGAVNQRLGELLQAAEAPFRGAQVGVSGLGQTEGMLSVNVVALDGSPMAGLRAALAEVERIARFGLSDTELERMKANTLQGAERSYSERHNIPSSSYAQAYAGHFTNGGELIDPAAKLQSLRDMLPSITNDDIKPIAALWKTKDNRVFFVTTPKRFGVMTPEESSILSSFSAVERMALTPYKEGAIKIDPLLATLPTPGRIVSRQSLAEGITEWTLSNGIRVLLRPSDFTTDMVSVQGASKGGFYLNMDSVGLVPASTVTQVLQMSGAGSFTAVELGKKLNGRQLRAGWNIGPFDESVGATAVRSDLETALQLMYLSVTQPRLDTAAIETYKAKARLAMASKVPSVEQAFQDTIKLTMSQNHPLVLEGMVSGIDSLNPERSLQVFRDRFSDMSDFRFVIVGNFELDSIAPLIEQYIGGLPGGSRVETFKDPGIHSPSGMIRKTVVGGTDPKTVTILSFYGPTLVTRKEQWELQGLGQILQLRLTERLREELGGTYSVEVSASATPVPEPRYSIDISFVSAPERADELTKATLAVLEKLQQELPLESDMHKVREAQRRRFEEQFKQDGVWAQRITLFDDLKIPFSEIRDNSVVEAWTGKDVQAAAKRFINLKSFAHFDLVPTPPSSAAAK